nr:hypothetical protein [Candidatus Sigynarchaeota archaeon]
MILQRWNKLRCTRTKSRLSNDFASFLYFYITFAVAIGIAYFVGQYLPAIPTSFIIAETGEVVPLDFDIAPLVEVVMLGPIFCVTSWKANNMLKANIPVPDDDYGLRRLLNSLNALYIGCITIVMAGGALHGMANLIHNMLKAEGLTSNPVYYTAYFWDEILSHYMIPGGYFGMLFINAALDSRVDHACPPASPGKSRSGKMELARGEAIVTIIMAIGLGFVWTYALLEGQAAFVYWFVFLGCACVIISLKIRAIKAIKNKKASKWHFSIWKNPYVLLALVFCIVNAILVIIWAAVFHLKPFPPFLYQPSEVC